MSTVTDGSTISLSTTISQSLHHRHSVHQHTVLLPLEKCGWCYNCNKLVSWPVSDNNSRHGPHLAPWCHSAFYCFRGRAGQDNYYKSRLFVDWSVFCSRLFCALYCAQIRVIHVLRKNATTGLINHFKKLFNSWFDNTVAVLLSSSPLFLQIWTAWNKTWIHFRAGTFLNIIF